MENKRGNPNHPVILATQDQWYKLCAVLMFKMRLTEVNITSDDIEQLLGSGMANIVIHPKEEVITLRLVSDEEGARLAQTEGGLP